MRIEYCPNCGEPDPTSGVDGALSCDICDWFFDTVGHLEMGTHPKAFDRYCEHCRTVYQTRWDANAHLCSAEELFEVYGDGWPVDAVVEALTSIHGVERGEQELLSALSEQVVVFEPGFDRIVRWPDTGLPALCDELLSVMQARSGRSSFGIAELQSAVGCSSVPEQKCVFACLTALDRDESVELEIGSVSIGA